jgi:hypothetical protein
MSAFNLSDELHGCDFGDARLNKRACKVIDALGQKPNISIPAALTGRADIAACYRLMDNENVKPEKVFNRMWKHPTRELSKKTLSWSCKTLLSLI